MRDLIQLIFDDVVSKVGTKLYSKKELVFDNDPLFPIMFSIDPRWDIKAVSHPESDKIFEECVQEYGIKYELPIATVMQWGLSHEHGHWKFCPYDVKDFGRIINGIAGGLESIGVDYMKQLGAAKNIINMFSDIIVNTLSAFEEKDPKMYKDGMDMFYMMEGLFQKKMEGKYSKAGELFLSTQYSFFGNHSPLEKAVMSNFRFNRPNDNIIKKLVNKVRESKELKGFNKTFNELLKIYSPTDLIYKKVLAGNLNSNNRKAISNYLSNPNNWEHMAYDFARVMYNSAKEMKHQQGSDHLSDQFIEIVMDGNSKSKDKGQQMKAGGNDKGDETSGDGQESEDDREDSQGQGYKPKDNGQDDEDKGEKSKGADKNNDDKNSELEKFIDNMTEKHKDIKFVINKEFLKKLVDVGRGLGNPIDYADQFYTLDSIYRKRAENIMFDLKGKPGESNQTRIAYLTHEPISNGEGLDLQKVDFSKSIVMNNNNRKSVILCQGDVEETSDDPSTQSIGYIRDILWMLDSSGSMSDSFGDIYYDLVEGNGPYDLVLRSFYSSIDMLEKTGKAYSMKYGLMNYSRVTKFSGWKEYKELDDIKKAAFYFQGGGTVLSPAKIKKVCREREDNFLAFLITDGELDNSSQAADALAEMISMGNDLIILYIDKNRKGYNNLIESMGNSCKSHIISEPEDIIGLKLELVNEEWGRGGNIFSYL